LWSWWDPAILSDLLLGESWLCPFWLDQHFSKQDLRYVGIEEGGCVAILRNRGSWVGLNEVIFKFGFAIELRKQERRLVWAVLVSRGFEVVGYQ
jgi:hypothetical protein